MQTAGLTAKMEQVYLSRGGKHDSARLNFDFCEGGTIQNHELGRWVSFKRAAEE